MLYATDMPGVLTEIGFMSNQQELAYMKSDRGQNEIARSLYQAIRNYSAYVLGTRMAEEEQGRCRETGRGTACGKVCRKGRGKER